MAFLTLAEGATVLRPVLILVVSMTVYAIFIFKFYKFVAKRDIFRLNLERHNKSANPNFGKFKEISYYIFKHILLYPIIAFFWFAVITVLLAFMSTQQALEVTLLASMAVVGGIRATAYYNEELAIDMSKMLPFTLLGIFLINQSYFSISQTFETLKTITSMWKTLLYYLIFMVILELVLRIMPFKSRKPEIA